MGAGRQRRLCCLAGVDRAVIEHDDDRLGLDTRPGAVELVEGFQKKSALRLVQEVVTMRLRALQSTAPIIATFIDCPGAGMRRSAPRLAQLRAR